jgi:hypothetical protein
LPASPPSAEAALSVAVRTLCVIFSATETGRSTRLKMMKACHR